MIMTPISFADRSFHILNLLSSNSLIFNALLYFYPMAAIVEQTTNSEPKLSWARRIGYGVGRYLRWWFDRRRQLLPSDLSVDVVRLSPALAGTVILISKVYDSITDPFEGLLSDRTRIALGRRRPYFDRRSWFCFRL